MSARKRPGRKTASKTASARLAPSPPQGGAQLPLGAHAGNTGGKPGRSGRPPDALRAALRRGIDRFGINLLSDVLSGRVTSVLDGVCEHCGKKSMPREGSKELEIAPDVEARLRAFDLAARYGLGPSPHFSVDEVRECLRATAASIRERAPEDLADDLLQTIHGIWRRLG